MSGTTIQTAKLCLVVAVLTTTSSCDKMIATKDAQQSFIRTSVAMVYADLQVPINDALLDKAADKADSIPTSLSLDDRFHCSYETMVVADLARRRAGKQSFSDTGRLTDDILSAKVVKDAILLSDQPLPPPPVTERFFASHIAEYEVPSDEDAVFVHAVWRAAYLRSVTNKFGVEGLTGPEAERWISKGRSEALADELYRKRANLGFGERRCYDLLGIRLAARDLRGDDMNRIARALMFTTN